jgi:hypothetical protein
MLGLVAAVAIMMIFSLVAFQEWHEVVRRDNEAEMIFRAQDIARAIHRFRKDHGRPPFKLEELIEPGGPQRQYYLRRLWKDPLVRDGKWGLLHLGPGNAIIDASATPGEPTDEQQRDSRRSSIFAPVEPRAAQPGLGGSGGQRPSGQRARRMGRASEAAEGQAGLTIAGVKSLCTDEPFRVYKGLTEYSQWHFTFLDLEAVQLPGGNQRGGARQGTPPGQDSGLPGATPGGGSGGGPGSPGWERPKRGPRKGWPKQNP